MKLAIVGTGKIAGEALFALQYVKGIDVVAICSRPQSEAKARVLADKYKIKKVYTDYDALLADGEVEFVYIGIVNSMHFEYGRRALLSGRHVVMEKPFTACLSEAEELRRLALERGLYIFEAVTLFYVDTWKHIVEAVRKIGPVRLVQSNYSQYSSRYDRYLSGDVAPAFDPALAGGAMNDINVYNLNLVVGLFGCPKEVVKRSNIGFNGVDTSGVALLVYDGFVASCCGAKDSASPGFTIIQAERGYIHVKGIPSMLEEVEVCVGDEHETFRSPSYPHRMVPEFVEMERIYREGDYKEMRRHLDVSINVMNCL